jgi:acyl-coenzyme A thioesterase PaaI-like protein
VSGGAPTGATSGRDESDPAAGTAGPPPGAGFPGADGPAVSTGDEPLNRAAAAIRRISAAMVGQPVPDDVIADAAERLSVLADEVEASTPARKVTRQKPIPSGHPQDFFPTSPMTGFANPVAPPVEVWAVVGADGTREVRGRATLGYQYEGPPTCVHGGVIAELFDEILGLANLVVGEGAMTGTLTVRYRRPTPLLSPLELVARHTGRERRKVFTWGGIYYEGELTAEAEGIFIHVGPDRMVDIVTGNANNSDAPLVDADWQRIVTEARVPGHEG